MNNIDFVADTNFLLYVLEGRPEVSHFLRYRCAVSTLSEIELLGWHKIKSEEKLRIQALLDNCLIVDLNSSIKQKAITLRTQCKLKTVDSIIAATALELDLPLVTADKQMAKVEQVQLLLID